jgi:hypothetical protein
MGSSRAWRDRWATTDRRPAVKPPRSPIALQPTVRCSSASSPCRCVAALMYDTRVMIRWRLSVAACILLSGCTAERPTDQDLAVRGYWYHDANHMGGSSGHASKQAIYNATHGTWLWPPAEKKPSHRRLCLTAQPRPPWRVLAPSQQRRARRAPPRRCHFHSVRPAQRPRRGRWLLW